MSAFSIVPLSGSTDFRGIKIGATSSPGTTVHTAQASATLPDLVTLQIENTDTSDRPYVIEWGGTTSPDDRMTGYVPAGVCLTVVAQKPIRNALVVKMASITTTVNGTSYTGATNVLVVHGSVQRQSS